MQEYCVRWYEEHECIVKAEDEDEAIIEALEQAGMRDTKVDEFDFRVEKEEGWEK